MANYSDYEAEERTRLGRGWVTWFIGALVAVTLVAFSTTPSGYVVRQPGGAFDTLGTIEIDGDTVPLVDIPMEETFPATGSLSMVVVDTYGDREQPASWGRVVAAWFTKSFEIVPLDEAYPPGITTEQQSEYSAALMADSQERSVAAALSVLGEEYTTFVRVGAPVEGGPSDGVLESGDVIAAVNAQPLSDTATLRELLDKNTVEKPATLSIIRAGASKDVQVTPVESDSGPIIGVDVREEFDFPFDVSIQLEGVGGPSAGHIFALAIIDKLTPGSLTGGADVAGTGTISEDGTIGAIGGIHQKMYGALEAGATYFLAPAVNCDDVVGEIPDGLSVFAVSTLADSLAVLNTIASGASTALLPRCEP